MASSGDTGFGHERAERGHPERTHPIMLIALCLPVTGFQLDDADNGRHCDNAEHRR